MEVAASSAGAARTPFEELSDCRGIFDADAAEIGVRVASHKALMHSWRIITAWIERMAAANSPEAAPHAPYGPVFFHSLNEVGAAGRLEAAMAADERTQRPLIDARR